MHLAVGCDSLSKATEWAGWFPSTWKPKEKDKKQR